MARFVAAFALLLLLPARPAAADARQLFQSGYTSLQAGKAEYALKDFEQAYAELPERSLLFWLGEAHYALGHQSVAEEYYRKYLVEFPGGPRVPEAKERLAKLTGKPLAPPAPPSAPSPAAPAVAVGPPTPAAPVPAAPAPIVRAPEPQFGAPRAPPALTFVAYSARLVVVTGSSMNRYATYRVASSTALYTHGVAMGRQDEMFKNAVYFGFGTEWGGGSDTLQRYELSWQFAWAPLGTESLFSPRAGFRLGGMMVASEFLTGASLKPGVLLAPEIGVDLQIIKWVVLTGSLSYDWNLGPDLGKGASVSGYAFNLGGAVRF